MSPLCVRPHVLILDTFASHSFIWLRDYFVTIPLIVNNYLYHNDIHNPLYKQLGLPSGLDILSDHRAKKLAIATFLSKKRPMADCYNPHCCCTMNCSD